ncbi:MAG: ABC transporter permease [Pseudomonadota bacterium]
MQAQRPAWSDAWGSMALAWYCLVNAHVLRLAPHRERFLRVLLDIGARGLADAGLRAAAFGTLLIAPLVHTLTASPELTVRLLAVLLVREAGPLLAAILLLLRSGTMLAARLSSMSHDGEARSLRLLGLSTRDYLAVPAVLAFACATLILTFYFELAAVAGGIVISAVLLDLPVREMFSHLALALTPLDVCYVALKSTVFGVIIATFAAWHGLDKGEHGSVPETVSRAVMQSLFALLLFNGLAAMLLYGMLAPAG